MFASDTEDGLRKRLEAKIKTMLTKDLTVAGVLVVVAIGCIVLLVHEALLLHRLGFGFVELVEMAIIAVAAYNAKKVIGRKMLEDYKAPGGNELYRSAVTDGQDIAQLGKLIKQRKASRGHYLRVRMKNGHPYELGMDSSEEADALLAWLLAKAPHAQPYA